MSSDGTWRTASWLRSLALAASFLTFLAFAANVLYGRFAPTLGLDPALRLARVPEFLLLFASATLFIIAALAAERQADTHTSPKQSQEGEP